MKRIVFLVLICGIMILGMTGCNNSKKDLKKEDLQSVSENKNIINISSEKSCEYIRTYKFLDYYDYDGATPEDYFIVLDQYQSFVPIIVGLNTIQFQKDFKKNQNYEITYKKTVDYSRGFLMEDIQIIKIESTDKVGMDQTQDACVLK